MNQMLDELTMISDILDVGGFILEADAIDKITKEATEQKINRPWSRETKELVTKIDNMLSTNENVSKELRNELISELNGYLLENEAIFKERGEIDPGFATQENRLISSIKNLFQEINDPNINEEQREKEIAQLAGHMEMLRTLDLSRRPKDKEKAEFIRNSLGENVIKGVEELLTKYANKIGINEFTLPPVLINSLQYYKDIISQKSKTANAIQRDLEEFNNINKQVGQYRWLLSRDLPDEASEETSREINKLLQEQEVLNNRLQNNQNVLKEADTNINNAIRHIKKLLTHLQIVVGADSRTSDRIREAVGEENLKLLHTIGNTNE